MIPPVEQKVSNLPPGRKVPSNDNPRAEGLDPRISSETFTKELIKSQDVMSSSSFDTLARESLLSGNVDRWLNGGATPMESTGVQNSRTQLVQRSTLAMTPSLRTSGMWYVLALVLPLFSIGPSCSNWRCSPRSSVLYSALSTVLSTAELLLTQISAVCDRIRNHIRTLAREQMGRDIFATTMNVVFVAYAFGFLILSMYQASVIG